MAQEVLNALQEPISSSSKGVAHASITAPSMPRARVPALRANKVRRGEYYGHVPVRNAGGADQAAIERRVENVASRAEFTQPERHLVSME